MFWDPPIPQATIRKHMTAIEVGHKAKHLSGERQDAEWVSPWAGSRNPPADVVSALCTLVSPAATPKLFPNGNSRFDKTPAHDSCENTRETGVQLRS